MINPCNVTDGVITLKEICGCSYHPSYCPNTAQRSFFPLESYSKKTLRKNVPKSARKYKRNVLMPPWASYNTP